MVSMAKGDITASTINVELEPNTKSGEHQPLSNKIAIGSNICSALRSALVMPYQWAFSFFIFIYCGSETTTQGFVSVQKNLSVLLRLTFHANAYRWLPSCCQ